MALEATRSEFAAAAVAVVKQWQFAPGVTSNPSPRREVVEFAFRRSGVVIAVQHMEAAQEAFNSNTLYSQIRTVKASKLDAPPRRLAAPMPAVSKTQMSQQGKPLLVNFVIDTAGNVRVPVAVAADPMVAETVLDAVQRWRYEPLTQNVDPVLVEATRSLGLPGTATSSP